jgi:Flp pilus assembly protein CpaB
MTIILLVVLGIVAGICAVVLVNGMQSTGWFSSGRSEVSVVQATRNLPKGTRLQADDLKMGLVDRQDLPSDAYMTNMAMVVGRSLADDVVEGAALMSYQCAGGGSIAELVSKLKPGMRAVSVVLSGHQVTGGLLYPGCIVDVLATFHLRGGYIDERKGEAVSTTLLERVEVLAIQGELPGAGSEEDKRSAPGPKASAGAGTLTVTLLLDTKQAEALQLAAANGSIAVTMRSPLDDKAVDPNPTVLNAGSLTRRGMLIDPIVRGQGGAVITQPDGKNAGVGNVFDDNSGSSSWEVKIIRGSKVSDEEIKFAD